MEICEERQGWVCVDHLVPKTRPGSFPLVLHVSAELNLLQEGLLDLSGCVNRHFWALTDPAHSVSSLGNGLSVPRGQDEAVSVTTMNLALPSTELKGWID